MNSGQPRLHSKFSNGMWPSDRILALKRKMGERMVLLQKKPVLIWKVPSGSPP